MRESILGCILGGAIGDAAGSGFEGGSSGGAWAVTDDTQLTLATCEGLLEGGLDPEAVAAAYLGPLAFSAPASAVLGFGPGMALGDTFGSAAFTWWEIVPALVSALALAGVVQVGFRTGRGRPGRGARRTGRPAPSTP